MSVIKAVNSKASIGRAVNYISQESKSKKNIISGRDCSFSPETAIKEMKTTKKMFDKEGGRTYIHFIQSFNLNDNVSPEKAHQIAREWANNPQFEGYEVLMATHTDQDHIHNHFIVNSVNYKTGKKYQQSKKDLQKLKDFNDRLSRKYNLTIPEKTQNVTAYDRGKYRAIMRHFNKSDKYKADIVETARTIDKAKKTATTKAHFIELMEQKKYKVKWKNNRKYITFTHPSGRKFRCKTINKNLKTNYSKEELSNEIRRNRRNSRERGDRERGRSKSKAISSRRIRDNDTDRKSRISISASNEISPEIQREISEITGRFDKSSKKDREKDKGIEELKRNARGKDRSEGGRTI